MTHMSMYLVVVVASLVGAAASAQVPERGSTPRLAVPARGAVAEPQATAPAPAAQVPSQPTTPPTATAAPLPQAPAATPPPTEPAPVPAVTGPPGGVTPIGAGATSGATASTSQAATASASRAYTAGKYGLTLDGVMVGWQKSVEGGRATAEVVIEKANADNVAGKHIAGVKYEPLVLVTDLQSKALIDWIAASWRGTWQRKNGSILAADYNYSVVNELEFHDALLVETTMPALDGGSRNAASITVKLAPEYTRLRPGSGAKAGGIDAKSATKWLLSNFRFEMAGLDGSKIVKIDSFTVRQSLPENPVGEMRDYEIKPGRIEFPNLRIILNAAAAQSWLDWHDDFVVKGNNGQDKERNGAIVYLTPANQELARVNLASCGIFRLSPEKVEAGAEKTQRMVAELYCERMEFSANGK